LWNRIAGVGDTDFGASPVSERECTQSPICFCKGHVVFWDEPGIGTMRHKAKDYFKQKGLFAMDVLILVCASRFTENDVNLAKQAKDHGIPVMFVRNKILEDIRNCKKREEDRTGKKVNEAIIAETVCTSVRKELYENVLEEGIFIPSSKIYCIEAQNLLHPLLDGENLMKDVGREMARRRS